MPRLQRGDALAARATSTLVRGEDGQYGSRWLQWLPVFGVHKRRPANRRTARAPGSGHPDRAAYQVSRSIASACARVSCPSATPCDEASRFEGGALDIAFAGGGNVAARAYGALGAVVRRRKSK